MSTDEIIKHIPEAVGVAKVAAASIPFTAIVKRMLGPAADELAEMWKDQIRLYRYERQLKCVEKAEKMCKDAGFTPQAVPPKILFPLLEGASFEEDEILHDMWASLLANAASPDPKKVRAGYLAILRQMEPDEAELLIWIEKDEIATKARPDDEDIMIRRDNRTGGNFWNEAKAGLTSLSDESPANLRRRAQSCGVALESIRLIEPEGMGWRLTYRGNDFLAVCRPPKPKP